MWRKSRNVINMRSVMFTLDVNSEKIVICSCEKYFHLENPSAEKHFRWVKIRFDIATLSNGNT